MGYRVISPELLLFVIAFRYRRNKAKEEHGAESEETKAIEIELEVGLSVRRSVPTFQTSYNPSYTPLTLSCHTPCYNTVTTLLQHCYTPCYNTVTPLVTTLLTLRASVWH